MPLTPSPVPDRLHKGRRERLLRGLKCLLRALVEPAFADAPGDVSTAVAYVEEIRCNTDPLSYCPNAPTASGRLHDGSGEGYPSPIARGRRRQAPPQEPRLPIECLVIQPGAWPRTSTRPGRKPVSERDPLVDGPGLDGRD
jgi:hypothetical protein